MLTCCLCGSLLEETVFNIDDNTREGATYIELLDQILEGEEKDLLNLLGSGELCPACVEILESIQDFYQKIRELKLRIITGYNNFVTNNGSLTKQHSVEPLNYLEEGSLDEQEGLMKQQDNELILEQELNKEQERKTQKVLNKKQEVFISQEVNIIQEVNTEQELNTEQEQNTKQELNSEQEQNIEQELNTEQDLNSEQELISEQDLNYEEELNSDPELGFDGRVVVKRDVRNIELTDKWKGRKLLKLEQEEENFKIYSIRYSDNSSPAPISTPSVIYQTQKRSNTIDIVLEESRSTELTMLTIDLEKETWSALFSVNPRNKESLATCWNEILLPVLQEQIQFCDIALEPLNQIEQLPHFKGFCKFCLDKIQIRVMKDYKLELEYSGRNCSEAGGNHVTKICEYCLQEFSSQDPASHSDIRFHLSSHHGALEDQVYSCKCGREFSKKGSRNFHYKRCESSSISEQQNTTCEYCGKLMKNLNRLNLHMKHCKRDVMCELCSKLFSTGRKLEEHMYAVHGDTTSSVQGKREYPCDECDKVFRKKYNLESHKLMHSDFKQFLCDVEGCGRRFKRHVTLRQHIDSVHNKLYSTVYCNFCTAQFKSRSGLRLHIAAAHAIGEAGLRKYKCNECDKMFKCSADLKVHTVSHTKEKAYSCDICGQKFARNNSLTEHMNIHSRKFPCDFCEKCFGRERYLKGHQSTCSLNPLLSKEKVDVEDIYTRNHEHTTVIITKNEGKDVCTPLQIVHATPSGVLTLPSVTLTVLKDPGGD